MNSTFITNDKIICKNETICQFYAANPHVDFEIINNMFISMLQHSVRTDSPIMDMNRSENVDNRLIAHIDSLKDCYIKELRSVFNDTSKCDIAKIFDEKSDAFFVHIKEIIETVEHRAPFNEGIIESFASLTADMKQMITLSDHSSIKEFIGNYDMKITMLLQNMQQPIYSLISASEDRINNNINSLKSISSNQTEVHAKFLVDIGEVLAETRRALSPTFFDNKMLSSVLTKIYSSAEILNPNSLNEDELILKRLRKENILFKNFILETNVPSDDISIFIQTVDDNNCNGILVSQQSGISTKKNYQIDMHNNRIIVYIHNAEYNPHNIQIAVDIIDNLSSKLHQYKSKGENDDFHIPKDVLDIINNEYQLFVSQKGAIVEVFKEQQKKVLSQVDELKFPILDKILSTKYLAPTPKPGLKCDLCKSYFANNLKALAAHKRGCIRKQSTRVHAVNSCNILSTK